ncbi:Alpha-hemolysin translocation ATP-binding protein HlyB [Pseudobythopirellula maris]|uniref:Alpha-hemolysin translocation ATP-binding protein HlyB n=1 Tax=Pseudobythopirellula maris TaxID=2527991 RepID=A0A5C5ZJ36_9BACT|nr:ATP-binding cassette domain-containing protein [Pseudobythopirellula maris]TWT87135.1 Alpha-hemolysin translocation ATP-binding protein HlyB [Pseudobythopirellula maris]
MSIGVAPSASALAGVLVRVSRECRSPIEHLRAEQLLREARDAWPGAESDQWRKWLAEACRSLNLRAHEAQLGLKDARGLAESGATVLGLWDEGRGPLVIVGGGSSAELAVGEIDERSMIIESALASGGGGASAPSQWLVVESSESVDSAHNSRFVQRPVARLQKLLAPEWNDIWIILVFAFFAGVLNLSTPIAVESLVNTVTFGRLLQPLLVLALLLFAFLGFAAVMRAMQTYVAEVIQRRLFARVSADLAYRLPRVDTGRLGGAYGPELANRFFDVVTLQKVVAQLLLDGVSLVLATLVGMTVLAFYHPWLLGFDVLLLLLVVGGLFVLGRGAIRTGIDESKYKYRLAAWFEDLIRCGTAFKPSGGAEFAADRANLLTTKYLSSRRTHFSVLFRQIVFVLTLQAVAGTVLLGGGGWLVIQGQLSLGQLVAAELIVSTILGSLAKIGKHLEGFYDLVAAIDKLGVLFDLPVERHDGALTLESGDKGLLFSLKNLRLSGVRGRFESGVTIEAAPGDRVAVFGGAKSGKSALCRLLYGAADPAAGRVTIAGLDPRDARPDMLRSSVALASEPEIFEGSLADNVHLRRREVGTKESRAALEAVGLLEDCLDLVDGLDTPLTPAATPLSGGQQRLLMLARAIAGKPKLLLVDGVLDGLPDEQLERALSALLDPEGGWTLLLTTGRQDLADRFERVLELTAPNNRALRAPKEASNA